MSKEQYLGHHCRDRITGFTGIVTGYVEYLTGCSQCLLVPSVDSEGKLREGSWFDVQRLEHLTSTPPLALDNEETPGADAAPTRTF